MSKFINRVRQKFDVFKQNIFLKRNKKGKIISEVRVARLNDHKFFSQRFKVYLNSKKQILQSMGLSKTQIEKIIEIAPISMVGLKTYQSQTISLNAAMKIKKFIETNKPFLIDVLKDSNTSKPHPRVIHFVDWLEKSISGSIKNKNNSQIRNDFNKGVVERADYLLLKQSKHGSKPIFVERILLMTLAELEINYVKSLIGKKYSAFVVKDKECAKNAFGEGLELII